MKRLRRVISSERDENEINLTPMLDVVFIMLIFFIVTATFIRETGLEANRSADASRSPAEPETILVTIDSSDAFWIDGRAVDQSLIRAHIERLHAANPDWPVVIDPHAASTTGMLVAAMDAARMSRVSSIAIAGGP